MRVKVERTGDIIDADYEPECVIWTDDGGPYTYYTSVMKWAESMLNDDGDNNVWYGTHNDIAFIAGCADELKQGHRIHLTWYMLGTDNSYGINGARFFTTPLYIDSETDDWYYPDEVEVLDDGHI